ncbi:MAG: type 4a pilus biogenesis protein PilO [Acidobacteriota bacterium]|nr:type 4a pilus biogenesis protein PilO [Acidobacteriota bacterium]
MAKSFNDIPAPIQGAILVTVAVALAGGTFWYCVLPLSDQKDGLDREVKKLKAENDKNEAFKQQQTEYLNRIKQLESQLETLRSIVPDEQATDEFMKTVFADGAGTSTQIRTLIPKPAVVKDFYVEMPFVVRLDGTYYSLLSFFERLAREQRIMSVSGLSLGTPEGGGMGAYKVATTETVGANCVLTTYYNKPLTAAAPPPPKKK